MKKILPSFSFIFHPLFIPLFGTLFYLAFNDNYLVERYRYLILIQVAITTILLPMSFYYLLKAFNKVDSIMISEVSQRKLPLMIQMVLLLFLLRKSTTIALIPELYFFFLGGLISAAIAFGVLFLKIKASLHMLGISSLTAFAIGFSLHNEINLSSLIIFLILVNGFVANSRLEMNAHSIKELAIGFFMGLLPQILLWVFWL